MRSGGLSSRGILLAGCSSRCYSQAALFYLIHSLPETGNLIIIINPMNIRYVQKKILILIDKVIINTRTAISHIFLAEHRLTDKQKHC